MKLVCLSRMLSPTVSVTTYTHGAHTLIRARGGHLSCPWKMRIWFVTNYNLASNQYLLAHTRTLPVHKAKMRNSALTKNCGIENYINHDHCAPLRPSPPGKISVSATSCTPWRRVTSDEQYTTLFVIKFVLSYCKFLMTII